jgi:hypothetical protein
VLVKQGLWGRTDGASEVMLAPHASYAGCRSGSTTPQKKPGHPYRSPSFLARRIRAKKTDLVESTQSEGVHFSA